MQPTNPGYPRHDNRKQKGNPYFLSAIIMLLCFLAPGGVWAQSAELSYQWARALNNAQQQGGNITVNGLHVDLAGNVYVAGSFAGTADFDPGAGVQNRISAGSNDIFIAKYTASGAYVFVRTIGGPGTEGVTAMQAEASGNIYITGTYAGTADFDPGAGVQILTSLGTGTMPDIYIARYTADGEFVYAKSIGSNGADMVSTLAVDGSGNLYITGQYSATASPDFDPGAGTVTLSAPTGGIDLYLAKYDAAGNYVFAKEIKGSSNTELSSGMTIDVNNNLYITGYFTGTMDFDPGAGTANLTSFGPINPGTSQDVFVAKYDLNGNYLLAFRFGGTNAEGGNAVAIDAAGAIHVTGFFSATADFDPANSNPGAILTSAGGPQDIFLAKYTAAGEYVYAIRMGSNGADRGMALTITPDGNACVAGFFNGMVDFDPGLGVQLLTSNGSSDLFFAKYNGAGNYVFAKSMGGASSENLNVIRTDASGNIYIGGGFPGTVDFDPGAGVQELTAGESAVNAFFGKYTSGGDYTWAKMLGGYPGAIFNESATAVATDAAGNSYVTGFFAGTVDFDPGPGTVLLQSAGGNDIFIAKYTAAGNLLYARAMGGTGAEQGNGIAVDATGNVYITGVFTGTVDFDPGPDVANLFVTGGSNNDVFLAKYDVSGNLVYAKNLGGTSADQGLAIAVDAAGNAYITGTFAGTLAAPADFDPGAGIANLVSAGGLDLFVAKYDAAGNYVYAKRAGGTAADWGTGIAVDAAGNVHVTGYFTGTAAFDSESLVSTGGTDIFFAKYNAAGDLVYAKKLGGASADQGVGIKTDATGNVYVTGYYTAAVGTLIDFDPGPGVANVTALGGQDAFVAKYDGGGNYVYARIIGGTGAEQARSLAVGADGLIYVAGIFNSTADANPGGTPVLLTSNGDADIFISVYDAAGNLRCAGSIGGTAGDQVNGIALSGADRPVVVGFFQGTVDFDPGTGTASLLSYNNQDMYVATYRVQANTWIGNTGDWHTPGNWSLSSLPLNEAVIPAIPVGGYFPVITGVAAPGTLRVESGASVTVDAGGLLNVQGMLENNGHIDIHNNGSLLQGVASVRLGTGSYTVRRNGATNTRHYNYWSAPVFPASVNLLGGNRYFYDPALGTEDVSDDTHDPGWKPASGTMQPGRGYASTGAGATVFSGTVYNAPDAAPLEITVQHPAGGTGLNLVGNPFPSAIRAATFLEDNIGVIDGTVWLWDQGGMPPFNSADYATINSLGAVSGGGTQIPNGNIASCQGFFVRRSSEGNSIIQFRNSHRSPGSNAQFFSDDNISRIRLSLVNPLEVQNELLIGFKENATTGMDPLYDSRKLSGNSALSFYSYAGDEKLAIQGLPVITEEQSIPLGFRSTETGLHRIVLKQLEHVSTDAQIYIEDLLTGEYAELQASGEYVFEHTGSPLENRRFILHFKPAGDLVTHLPEQPVTSSLLLYPNPAAEHFTVEWAGDALHTTVRLYDLAGRETILPAPQRMEGSRLRFDTKAIPPGCYFLEVRSGTLVRTGKLLIRY